MKKRILPLLLALVLLLGTLPAARAASPVYFPEFAAATGCGMTPDKAWPAIGSSAVPSQNYFGQTDDWENCKQLARDYIDLLVATGDFTVVSPFKVVYGKEGGEDVQYSADLRYTGSAPMGGTLKAMRAGGTWPDYGEYHITVRAVRNAASYVKANRRNHVEVLWDKALRPEGIDFYVEEDPKPTQPSGTTTQPSGTTTQPSGTTTQPSGTTTRPDNTTTPPATGTGNAVGNSDNTFQDFGSAMGYYLHQDDGSHYAVFEDKTKNPVSYETLLQFAQEYVDLLVGEDNFYLVSPFKDNDHGGTQSCYIRYVGTAPMEENLAAGDYIPWFHYSPYHIKVSVTQTDNVNYRYITVAWDKGLEPVESTRRTASGAKLGSAERPPETVTAVLAIGYPWMAVGNEVIPVDALSVEVCPIIENSRTLVPVSRILAALGGESSWDGATRTATFRLGNSTVVVPIGSTRITVNGVSRTIDTAAKIYHSRTYAPLRAVLEGLGLWVGYEPVYHLVVVSTDDLSQTKDLVGLGESQRLFASEPVPETPTKIVERYAIDNFNYTMEVGEALTLFNPRSAISSYSAYSWDVPDGGELVHRDPQGATCRFYAKRPGVVTVRANLDETIVNYFGGSTVNTYTYTMTITILPSTGTGSSGGLMKYKPCPSCQGSGTIRVGTREETCPTCLGRKIVLQ